MVLSGVRWSFLWQRHQTLATLFAAAGHPTVFVETTGLSTPRPSAGSLRKVARRVSGPRLRDAAGGVRVHAPLALPPTGGPFGVFRRLNSRFLVPRAVGELREVLGGERPLVVAYPPTRTTLELALGLSPRLLLYDCSDEYAAFPGAPEDLVRTERELLLRAEVVTCTSPRLLGRVRELRPDAKLLGPGVEYERFAAVRGGDPAGPPEVCYFGDLGPERISVGVLSGLAKAGFRVRVLGEVRGAARSLLKLPNVRYRGVVAHRDLPRALAGVGAFVLPYRENAMTGGISPAKLYECLATGLPTLATRLPALEAIIDEGLVYGAQSTAQYVGALRGLGRTESAARVAARRERARENSWERVFERLREVLCPGPKRR